MKYDYLMHYGVKGMKWRKRKGKVGSNLDEYSGEGPGSKLGDAMRGEKPLDWAKNTKSTEGSKLNKNIKKAKHFSNGSKTDSNLKGYNRSRKKKIRVKKEIEKNLRKKYQDTADAAVTKVMGKQKVNVNKNVAKATKQYADKQIKKYKSSKKV